MSLNNIYKIKRKFLCFSTIEIIYEKALTCRCATASKTAIVTQASPRQTAPHTSIIPQSLLAETLETGRLSKYTAAST